MTLNAAFETRRHVPRREAEPQDREAPLPDSAPGQVKAVKLLPPPDRDSLRISAWVNREIPLRDYLLGEVLCTTSRWMIYGETGLGKTLVAADIAGAVASGSSFLNWQGRKRARVMYLDGELPEQTFKERMQLVAKTYGEDLDLFGYSRDALADGDMPPLNTQAGAQWLLREIDAIKPDLIVFDAIMSLLTGSMSEEESWEPIPPLMRQLSRRRVAQIWLHHTGHDAARSFGTKTREWQLDTVISLTKADEEGEEVLLAFQKARLRTPQNRAQFEAQTLRREEWGWTVIGTGKPKAQNARGSEVSLLKREFLSAYTALADGAPTSRGLDGKVVRKVKTDLVVAEVKSRGYLETDDKGCVVPKARTHLTRAKGDLLANTKLVERNGEIWSP